MVWLLAHGAWSYLGTTLVLVIVVGLLIWLAPRLLFNRWVIGALAIGGTVLYLAVWWQSEKESLREEGRAEVRVEVAAVNAKAERERQDLIRSNQAETKDLLSEANQRLVTALKNLEVERAKRKPRVSAAADAACPLPLGFVRDHDAALPGADQRAAVPAAAGADDRASGIPLSVASAEIEHNYRVAAACVLRLDSTEEKRYQACLAWDRKFGTRSGCVR